MSLSDLFEYWMLVKKQFTVLVDACLTHFSYFAVLFKCCKLIFDVYIIMSMCHFPYDVFLNMCMFGFGNLV